METVKGTVVARSWGEGGRNRWSTKVFRAVELLCILHTCIRVITHLPKPTGYVTPRVNSNVKTMCFGECQVSVWVQQL